jgi:hypothetical protein
MQSPDDLPQCTLEEFFLNVPPESLRAIKPESLNWKPLQPRSGPRSGASPMPLETPQRYFTPLPELKINCLSEKCGGVSWFAPFEKYRSEASIHLEIGQTENDFIEYRCKSCEKSRKLYAVWFKLPGLPGQGKLLAYKFGEYPDYCPSLPAKVLRLVQSDAELFKKGWKAEKLSFGIAAFSYYRRIVENHKNELFDKIIEIATEEHLAPDKIEALGYARNHTQFSHSMDAIKDAIPESLKMMGHNPLLLLHDAFSKGVHELSDEQCLERAQSVRTILIALAERFALIRNQTNELKQAISTLFKEES